MPESEVAGGIAAALLTTALGLIVALLTLFPYMVFRSHASRALGRLESVIAAAQQGDVVVHAEAEKKRAAPVKSSEGTVPAGYDR